MKKLFNIIYTFVVVSILFVASDALAFTTKLDSTKSIDANSNFTVTMKLSEATDLVSLDAVLTYDTNKLELVSSKGLDGWVARVATKIAAVNGNALNGSGSIVELTFKAKKEFKPGETSKISVTNVKGSNSNIERQIGNDATVTIKVNVPKSSNNNLESLSIDGKKIEGFSSSKLVYNLIDTTKDSIVISGNASDSKSNVNGLGNKKLNYGKNTFNIVVTAENGSKKTYTVNITRKDTRSSDNTLSSLVLKPQNIKFSSNITNYSLEVDNSVSEISINAEANNSKAKVLGIGVKKLNVYNNKFNIVVTAENGNKKVYTINVIRKDELGNVQKLSTDNYLKELSIEGYDISFDKEITEYSISVNKTVDKLNIKAVTNDKNAQVTINNIEELKVGINTITIDVIAENGDKKVYTITVNKDDGIPRITVDELLSVIDTTESNTIIINIKDDNNTITKEMLEKVKAKNKILIINKYNGDVLLYSWEINGKDITDTKDINTLVEFYSSNEKIDKKFKNSNYIYLNNNLDTSIFNNIILKIYVDNEYNGEYIFGYEYENDKLIKKFDKLLYKDTSIEINNIEKGNYIITQSTVVEGINKVLLVIVIILILMIIILGIVYYRKKQKKYSE